MRLVHEQPVHAKFFKGQRVVFFVFGSQRLKFGFEPLLRLFKFFHQTAIGTVRVLALDHFQLVKLLLEKSFLGFAGKRDALKTGVSDDDGIPIAGGDAAEKFLAVLRLEILLAGGQDVCARIQRQQLGGELAEHVIGDDKHWLAGQAEPSRLHRGSDHGVGFACANDMGQKRVRRLQDAPDTCLLVRVKLNRSARAGQC